MDIGTSVNANNCYKHFPSGTNTYAVHFRQLTPHCGTCVFNSGGGIHSLILLPPIRRLLVNTTFDTCLSANKRIIYQCSRTFSAQTNQLIDTSPQSTCITLSSSKKQRGESPHASQANTDRDQGCCSRAGYTTTAPATPELQPHRAWLKHDI